MHATSFKGNRSSIVSVMWCRFWYIFAYFYPEVTFVQNAHILGGRLPPSPPSVFYPLSPSFCFLACLFACWSVRAQRSGARLLRGRGRTAGAARTRFRMQYMFFFCGWIPLGIHEHSIRLPQQLRLPFSAAQCFSACWMISGSILRVLWIHIA